MFTNDDDLDQAICRIIGIDPGSTTLGFSVLEYDARTLKIIRTYAFTFNAGKMKLSDLDIENHSERYARIYELMEALYEKFVELKPTFVICESPFMAMRRPQAYGALVEVVFAIRSALRKYDPTMSLDLIDPPSAKNAVGAPGNAKKEQVAAALKKLLPELHFDVALSEASFDQLDEHSVDGTAIAYSRWKKLVEE
jgi:Holliday junction resolvasome RuvABC endonuclease subunit